MKRIIFVVFFCAVGLLAYAQSFTGVINGITTQNMDQISSNLSSSVELTINSRPSTMRKNEAIKALGQYLKQIQPSAYKKGHQGNLDADQYQVGTLSSAEGKHRLYLFSESKSGLVKEIRLSAVQSN